MKNEILRKRLELLNEVKKYDIDVKGEYNELIEMPRYSIKYELSDNEGRIFKNIRMIEKLIIDMGDEYIDDEMMEFVLEAKLILNKYMVLKRELVDYLLSN